MTSYGIRLPSPAGHRLRRPGPAPAQPEPSFEHLAALTSSAERAGFDSVWVADDVLPPGHRNPAVLEAYTLLGALAARTERVQLGALVTDVASRNPGLLAKLVTTLDLLSGGRATLGVGGHDRAGVDRLGEALQICRALFDRDDVTFEGDYFALDHARNLPAPARPGGPRILVGAGDDRRTLSLAARYADRYSVTGEPAAVADTVAALRRLCEEIGRHPEGVEVAWTVALIVTSSVRQTTEVVGQLRSQGPPAGDGPGPGRVLVAQPGELPGLIADHLAAGAHQVYFAMPFADVDAIGEVGRALGLAPR